MPALGRVSNGVQGVYVVDISPKGDKRKPAFKSIKGEKTLDSVYSSLRKHFRHRSGSKHDHADRQKSDSSLLSNPEAQAQTIEYTTEAEIGFRSITPKASGGTKRCEAKGSPLSDHIFPSFDEELNHKAVPNNTRSHKNGSGRHTPLHERIGNIGHQFSLAALLGTSASGKAAKGKTSQWGHAGMTILESTLDYFLRSGISRRACKDDVYAATHTHTFPSSQAVAQAHRENRSDLRTTLSSLSTRLERRKQNGKTQTCVALNAPVDEVPCGRPGVWGCGPRHGRKAGLGVTIRGGGPSPITPRLIRPRA